MGGDQAVAARRALRGLQRSALERIFEPGLPESTRASIPHEDLGLAREDDHHYEAAGYSYVLRALYPYEIGAQDGFLDYGCGSGRLVWMAARFHPFGTVLGVEIVEQLAEAARRNLAAGRDRLRCADVDIVTADAMTWPMPTEITHVFHHNSVGGAVLQGMLERVVESYDARPRRLLFHYGNPLEDDRVRATGRFRPVRSTRGLRPDLRNQRILTYAVEG